MKKIKISELPLYQSLKGLFVMGTDVNNRSVKVNLEFIESETTKAVKDADTATAAAAQAAGLVCRTALIRRSGMVRRGRIPANCLQSQTGVCAEHAGIVWIPV